MTEIVESPDYPELKTKADIVIAGIDLFLTTFYDKHQDAPGKSAYELERRRALRQQRDDDFRFADSEFLAFKAEKDIDSMKRLLVHCHRLKLLFQREGASPVEMENVNRLLSQVEDTVLSWA
jgi:hypothetical protein